MSNKRQALVERYSLHRKTGITARVLHLWLQENEINANLEHIIQALENGQRNSESLQNRTDLICKFTNKAIQENQSANWLCKIEQVLREYQDLNKLPSARLFLSKFHCLCVFNTLNRDAENCLWKAVELSKDNLEKVASYLELARYYDSVSEYRKIKDILLKCEKLCCNLDSESLLADVLLELGRHYFQMYNLHVSKQYFIRSELILKKLSSQRDWKVLRMLSTCLHYMGRICFEKNEFVNAAEYYVKSQNLIEINHTENNVLKDIGATAFYHLRLGQLLEACQVLDSAKYHYLKSRILFIESRVSSTGLIQVELALVNLVSNYTRSRSLLKDRSKEKELQFKEVSKKALEVGYQRGYALALVQLFWFYIKSLRIHSAIWTFYKLLCSEELWKSGELKRVITIVYKSGVGLHGLGIHHRILLKLRNRFAQYKSLVECPCSDFECKKSQKNH